MDRDVKVLSLAVLKRQQVVVGWKSVFGAGDVEADNTVITMADGHLGDLETSIEMTHRRADDANGEVGAAGAGLEAGDDRLDHRIE